MKKLREQRKFKTNWAKITKDCNETFRKTDPKITKILKEKIETFFEKPGKSEEKLKKQ